MPKTAFNTETYEDQLAITLLEILYKKDVLAAKTYEKVKQIITKKEDLLIDTYIATNTASV